MAWSDKQRTIFLRASNCAGWNAQQRYVAMAHVGCPLVEVEEKGVKLRRPSVKGRNTNAQYELVMAIAEAEAEQRGRIKDFPVPANADSWRILAERSWTRMVGLIEAIAEEAYAKLPDKFATNFLAGFVLRMTEKDDVAITGRPSRPLTLCECDEGQLYRIMEGLKAWVWREFRRVDQWPRAFRMGAAA